MREINIATLKAFKSWETFKKQNRVVETTDDWNIIESKVLYKYTLIAELEVNPYSKDTLTIKDINDEYKTKTTKELLNTILWGFDLWSIKQIKWEWFYINKDWVKEEFYERSFIVYN